MIECPLNSTINITYLEASIEEVWRSIATPKGMNSYLTYTAEKTGSELEIEVGDQYRLNYGDIVNHCIVIELEYLKIFGVVDSYESIDPNGIAEYFDVKTTFMLEQEGSFVKVTLVVTGFKEDTYGQWFRECLEMGWKRSLMNLKSVLELGLDLRTEMFSYPRMGVVNCTVNSEQSAETGVPIGRGNYLLKVFTNSPADLAGLKKGDVITDFDNNSTFNYSEFVRVISSYGTKNKIVQIGYIREGKRKKTTAHLSLDDAFTGMIQADIDSLEAIRLKREKLAHHRSASGELWNVSKSP